LNKLLKLRRTLFDPNRNPLMYFVAAYFLAVSVNLFSSEPWLPWVKWGLEVGTPLVILVILLSPAAVRRLWPWGREVEPETTVYEARHCRGLVVLASPGPGIATAAKAVDFHSRLGDHLQTVWIFCSDSSGANADKLHRELADAHPALEIVMQRMTDAAFQDIESIEERIESEVYASLEARGWSDSDVILDFTGGTKTTTAGAILAGLPQARRMEFVPADRRDAEGRVIDPLAAGNPREIRIDYRMKRVRRAAPSGTPRR
jgi:hypothetical protein